MSNNIKIYCYDNATNSWVDNFKIHTVEGQDLVSINQTWATSDVDLYVRKIDYDLLKQENERLVKYIKNLPSILSYESEEDK